MADLIAQIAYDGDGLSVVVRCPLSEDGAAPFLLADVVAAAAGGFRQAFDVAGFVLASDDEDDEAEADTEADP